MTLLTMISTSTQKRTLFKMALAAAETNMRDFCKEKGVSYSTLGLVLRGYKESETTRAIDQFIKEKLPEIKLHVEAAEQHFGVAA